MKYIKIPTENSLVKEIERFQGQVVNRHPKIPKVHPLSEPYIRPVTNFKAG